MCVKKNNVFFLYYVNTKKNNALNNKYMCVYVCSRYKGYETKMKGDIPSKILCSIENEMILFGYFDSDVCCCCLFGN